MLVGASAATVDLGRGGDLQPRAQRPGGWPACSRWPTFDGQQEYRRYPRTLRLQTTRQQPKTLPGSWGSLPICTRAPVFVTRHVAPEPSRFSAISPPMPNPVDAILGNTHSPIAASRSKPLGQQPRLIFNPIEKHWLGPKPPPWGSLSPLLGGGVSALKFGDSGGGAPWLLAFRAEPALHAQPVGCYLISWRRGRQGSWTGTMAATGIATGEVARAMTLLSCD